MYFQNGLPLCVLQQIRVALMQEKLLKKTGCSYFHVTLFRIHERNKATEMDSNFAIEMALEYILAQRYKQITK